MDESPRSRLDVRLNVLSSFEKRGDLARIIILVFKVLPAWPTYQRVRPLNQKRSRTLRSDLGVQHNRYHLYRHSP